MENQKKDAWLSEEYFYGQEDHNQESDSDSKQEDIIYQPHGAQPYRRRTDVVKWSRHKCQ
jgi:hypothetical protein